MLKIGQVGLYKIADYDVDKITRQRMSGQAGFCGNTINKGDVYPMMITRLWGPGDNPETLIQGQVFLDGNDSMWATSVHQCGPLSEGAEQPVATFLVV